MSNRGRDVATIAVLVPAGVLVYGFVFTRPDGAPVPAGAGLPLRVAAIVLLSIAAAGCFRGVVRAFLRLLCRGTTT